MTQPDVEIQLKVWKDLAISKQVLMGAATDALGLDAECGTDELRDALNTAITRAKEADSDIAEMRQKMEASDKARSEAEIQVAEAVQARENAERQLAAGKAENAEALKKARNEVNDKQNQLKAISKALADSPENVVKKLKTLKKQKLDEARLKTAAEAKVQKLRKEKSLLESDLENQKSLVEDAKKLAEQLKEIHAGFSAQFEALKESSEDVASLTAVPELDEELIEKFLSEESGTPEKAKSKPRSKTRTKSGMRK